MVWIVEELTANGWVQAWHPMTDERLALHRFLSASSFGRTVRLTYTRESPDPKAGA